MMTAWIWVGLTLAAGPNPPPNGGGPEHPHHGPPPEAIEACAGKQAGTACNFTGHRGAVAGTCRAGPDASKPLACAPARPPEEPGKR